MKAYLETGSGDPQMLGIVVESETTEEASRLLDNLWLGPEWDYYPQNLNSDDVRKRCPARRKEIEMDANEITAIVLGVIFIAPLIYVAMKSKTGPFHGYYSQNKQHKEEDKEKPA